jgi:hypothetical protein
VANLEAIPTEYKGVVYRSKSEAMFARWLELFHESIGCHYGFRYEPDFLSAEWIPDFLVWHVEKRRKFPRISYTVIEYKPTKPTDLYLSQFDDKCQRIFKNESLPQEFRERGSFMLYYGSVFNSKTDCYALSMQEGPKGYWTGVDWLLGFEDQIKATRFDLETVDNG